MSILSSKQEAKGNSEKATALTNQKNESLEKGDEVNVNGEEATVTEGASTSEGTKYNVKLKDGTELNGVDEKVIDKPAETSDKKIADAINNAKPENRAKTAKKIYGIQSVENLHEYSLNDYMKMHGFTDAEITQYTSILKPKKKSQGSKSSGGGGSRSVNSKTAKKDQALSKRQLAMKLIAKHRMAVQAAVDSGITVSPSIFRYIWNKD